MTTQNDKAAAFARLHVKGDPIELFNVWDPGSARAVAKAGARALATGSWSVAAAHGFEDGEALPLELALANLARIVRAVDVPVTVDLESGYGAEPAHVGDSVSRALAAGAIGMNLEDRAIGGKGLYDVAMQAARLRAAREAARACGVDAWINARTDGFLQEPRESHDAALADAAIERARAYAEAGASSVFVPGIADETLIERVCAGSPLPVNVMVVAGLAPKARLAALGVARISHGPGPYRLAMKALEDAARALYGG